MNRIDTALARAANRALAHPGRHHMGRAGQIEVIAVVVPSLEFAADLAWVALEIDLALDEELALLDALAANDATSPGPVD